MRSIEIPGSMLELVFSLPDEHLAEIAMEKPQVLHSICIGLTLELYEIERIKSSSNRGIVH
jgi:hypothetical protein